MGLIGDGEDPIEHALGMKDPIAARDYLRAEEARRIGEIRQIVLNAMNNVPIRVGDVVEGGPLKPGDDPAARGVVVGCQTRLGRVMISRPRQDARGEDAHDKAGNRLWDDDDDVVQGVVLLRKGEESLPALHEVEALVKELNETPGRLLPGVRIDTCYDRKDLIHVTTNTVQENLLAGMGLVTLVLLMFLSNVRSALIVALNVPLALLVAFSLLFLRGKSANLLSIGAVDFGIIADSSVIIVENIYRHLSAGLHNDLRIGDRVIRAADEVQRSLLYSTAIMVCAFLPLFTMSGPEGQIFGPMADTYAFALGGAMLLAVTLSPVLCTLLLRRLRPKPENFLIRWLRERYLKQLQRCLHYRWTTVAVFGVVVAATVAVIPLLGREFMPELEEGNLWVRATFPLNISLDQTAKRAQLAE
jgi:cobalt-zinc-cadmium resistance protein CzcA